MSQSRPNRSYLKKDSKLSDSTSNCSQKNSSLKLVSAQRTPANKLSEFLYNNIEETRRSRIVSAFDTTENARKGRQQDSYRPVEDPFLKAKLNYMLGQSTRNQPVKKIGVLFDELKMDCFEDDSNRTTLKKQKEKSIVNQDISILQMFSSARWKPK